VIYIHKVTVKVTLVKSPIGLRALTPDPIPFVPH